MAEQAGCEVVLVSNRVSASGDPPVGDAASSAPALIAPMAAGMVRPARAGACPRACPRIDRLQSDPILC
jgi:hypothetical protein